MSDYWQPSEAWRDSYDSWKLATPPEYEGEESEASRLEEDAWHNGEYLSPTEARNIIFNRGGPFTDEEQEEYDYWQSWAECPLIDVDDFEDAYGA